MKNICCYSHNVLFTWAFEIPTFIFMLLPSVTNCNDSYHQAKVFLHHFYLCYSIIYLYHLVLNCSSISSSQTSWNFTWVSVEEANSYCHSIWNKSYYASYALLLQFTLTLITLRNDHWPFDDHIACHYLLMTSAIYCHYGLYHMAND